VLVSGFLPNDGGLLVLCVALQQQQGKGGANSSAGGLVGLPLALPSFHVYGAGDALVPPAASAATHAPTASLDSISSAEAALDPAPHHKRMLSALPGPPSEGGSNGSNGSKGGSNHSSSEAHGVPLFGGSACAVAVHGGGHLVPADKAVVAAFKRFVADLHAQRLGGGSSSANGGSSNSGNVQGGKATNKVSKASSKPGKAANPAAPRCGPGTVGGATSVGYVVMLHGFTQSGELFAHRCANLVKKVLKPLGLVPIFPDAPLLCPALYAAADRNTSKAAATTAGDEGSTAGDDKAACDVQRAWFVPEEMDPAVRPSASQQWQGWHASLEGLRDLLAGAVGVVGFSQGALMAALALSQPPSLFADASEQLPPTPTRSSSLRFGILVCSGDAHDPEAVAALDNRSGLACSSTALTARVLCVAGLDDPLVSVEACRALALRLAGDGAVVDLSSDLSTDLPGVSTAASALGTVEAPKGTVSFLPVAGGHGMPPNRDMSTLKAFVAAAFP
jgi:dienelactone hydrolase